MGAISATKMPKARVLQRKDGAQFETFKKGGWIADAVKKPGALHEQMGVPQGKKIPAAALAKAAKAPGKLGQRARLAQTFKKMK